MNIWFENANLSNNSGPNSFAQKLTNSFIKKGIKVNEEPYDISLCFIESFRPKLGTLPTIQRLDGIYFNTSQNYELQNSNIFRTYKQAAGVVFQSEFNKQLILRWFGDHKSYTVIHNGADLDLIESTVPSKSSLLDQYENVWCCAAAWRPHKRLQDNIKYFLEHSGPKDVLFIAGDKQGENIPKDSKIKYLGVLPTRDLIRLYKSSSFFVHLSWLDHCPNVVVDARASGCKIICSSSGGTPEIAGPTAIVVEEEPWDFQPVGLYDPPPLDFSRTINNFYNTEYNMEVVADSYLNFLQGIL